MKTKQISGIGMILSLVILMTSFALAFGVSSPYWKENPVPVYPGEEKTIYLGYQNMGDSVEDLNVRAEISKGGEIASLSVLDYFVAANTRDTQVAVIVFVPESAVIGTRYEVTVTSRTVTPGTEGGVGLGIGMDTTFDVLVVEKPVEKQENVPIELAEKNSSTILVAIFVLIAVIVIAIILLVLINSKKKKSKTSKFK